MKRKVGNLFGHNIFICRENELKKGEYRIILSEGKFAQIIDQNDNILLRTPVLNLQDLVVESDYNGDEVVETASEGYEGLNSVTYTEPYLVSKTITVTSTSEAIEVEPDNEEDGFSDVTIVFDLGGEGTKI